MVNMNFTVLVLFLTVSSICAAFVPQDIHKAMENVMHSYNQLGLKFYKPGQVDGVASSGTGCSCIGHECGCCAHLDIPKLHLDDDGCVNVTYLPDQYGISLTFSINGKVYYNETISATNPPPVCFAIPYLEKEASFCIDVYNINYTTANFGGCIKIEARLYHVLVQDIDLGCFHIPLTTENWNQLRSQGLWSSKKKTDDDGMKELEEKFRWSVHEVKKVMTKKANREKTIKPHYQKVQKMFKFNML